MTGRSASCSGRPRPLRHHAQHHHLAGPTDPLGKYVHSLMDISIFNVRLPLPAHRSVGGITMSERIGAIIEHHGARIREMLGIPEQEPGLTAYEALRPHDLAGPGQSPSWADFPLQQKWFAVGEAAAHIWNTSPSRGRAWQGAEPAGSGAFTFN